MTDYRSLQSALAAGGLIPGDIEAGSLRRCRVEGDRSGKKSGAYRLFDDEVATCIWWNWKTSATGVWVSSERPLSDADRSRHRQLIEQAKRERQQAQATEWKRNREYLTRLWGRAQPLTASCVGGVYLDRRGLDVPVTDALRFVPKLDYWHDAVLLGAFPAMLAAVTDQAGVLVNVHRTYLSSDGHKADVPAVKKLCKSAGVMAGASIKLGAPVLRPDGRPGLGIAEGIETAIAASILFGVPTWSCISAHGLETFTPPPEVRNLYVFADHDESGVGQHAARKVAPRLAAQGLTVRILMPDAVGDWSDELQVRRAIV
ncbi:toprim domain-containing protein [Castellaniella sp. MT123]|uniref:DUF7146 domain-containing protein n=1 Tax=Castellaniella sp. MT123 TaxID=3140381 RepID=UPI0031F43BBE